MRQRLRRGAGHAAALLQVEAADERLGQRRDVLAAVAQRRRLDREDVEPVEEVLAEAALGHRHARGRGWWPTGCARRPSPGACEPIGSISLSCSARSSLTCMSSGSSPTSSRNRVPPLASWNLPRCFSVAPVKLPFSWPNRIELDQVLGDRAAVHGHERTSAALGTAVHGPGDHFLARAALAGDQHRDRRLGGALAQALDHLHGRARADQVLEGGLAAGLLLQRGRPRRGRRPSRARCRSRR